MTDMIDLQTIIPIATAISGIGGAWFTIRKIANDIEKSRKEQSRSILIEAKEEDSVLKAHLEAKIKTLQLNLENLEANIGKDLEHLRFTYNNEIKNLGEKIEALRIELKDQHSQLVTLLTEIVKRNI